MGFRINWICCAIVSRWISTYNRCTHTGSWPNFCVVLKLMCVWGSENRRVFLTAVVAFKFFFKCYSWMGLCVLLHCIHNFFPPTAYTREMVVRLRFARWWKDDDLGLFWRTPCNNGVKTNSSAKQGTNNQMILVLLSNCPHAKVK